MCFFCDRIQAEIYKRGNSLKVVKEIPTTNNEALASVEDDNNDENTDTIPSQSSPHHSRNPNLTLISVYSPHLPSNIQVNVKHSRSSAALSRPSQVFSVFKFPRTDSS